MIALSVCENRLEKLGGQLETKAKVVQTSRTSVRTGLLSREQKQGAGVARCQGTIWKATGLGW